MGNCFCCCILGTKEKAVKNDGTVYYDYPALVGQNKDYVLKILGNTYPSYQIKQRLDKEMNCETVSKNKCIDIYFSDQHLVTKIEIFP